MSNSFEGRTALVTGGATGIGRATAQAFAARGANVVIGDVNVEGAEETAQLIADAGGQAFFHKTDVTDSQVVASLVNSAVERYGSLDFAFKQRRYRG